MTVEKVKKSGKKSSKAVLKADNFKYLDNLMERIESFESEEQVSEIFEEDGLLSESFNSLMTLMEIPKESHDENDFDCEGLDEKVAEIMSKLLDEGYIDEEEFEDFLTDELADEDGQESDDSDDQNEEPSEDDFKAKKMSAEEKKKAKNMKELEMLMEKVDEESDFDDEEESESDSEDVEDEADETEDKKDIFGEDEELSGGRLSSFEKAQLALKTQIATLESEQLESQKPWALRGEINARQRPSDSLLEEAVDFDNLSRPTPQITEERTEEIEDIIKRRIGEAAWDDVERKDGRDLTLLNGMQQGSTGKPARALLEDVATANPQRSLTQVYEDAATAKLTGATAKDQETLEKEAELTALFAKICRHVDGLSGNRFAPKVYVQSDFQIKTLGGKK